MKEKIVRFGVSMEKGLLEKFDKFLKEKGYRNRSEGIRDLIRKEMVEEEWEKGMYVAGCINLVYDHHQRELVSKIIDIQHHYHRNIISTQHIHMDQDNCLEIIAIKGKVENIKSLYFKLKALKGVKYCEILKATTGKKI